MPLSLHDLDESCERGCGELGGHSGTLAQPSVLPEEALADGLEDPQKRDKQPSLVHPTLRLHDKGVKRER